MFRNLKIFSMYCYLLSCKIITFNWHRASGEISWFQYIFVRQNFSYMYNVPFPLFLVCNPPLVYILKIWLSLPMEQDILLSWAQILQLLHPVGVLYFIVSKWPNQIICLSLFSGPFLSHSGTKYYFFFFTFLFKNIIPGLIY